MANVGRSAKPPNSYLNQFLSAKTADDTQHQQDAQQQDDVHVQQDTNNPKGDDDDNPSSEGLPSRVGHWNGSQQRSQSQEKIQAHEAVPRSPPLPTRQPPSPQTFSRARWKLSGSTLLYDEDEPEQPALRRRDLDSSIARGGGSGGVGSISAARVATVGTTRRRRLRQEDEESTLLPCGSTFFKTCSSIAASSNFGGKQRKKSAGLTYSSIDRHRWGSTLVPAGCRGWQQRRHADSGDRDGNGDGQALSARESSALFWEESESLEARSTSASHERLLGGFGGLGRGASAPSAAAAAASIASRGKASTPVLQMGRGRLGRGRRDGPPKGLGPAGAADAILEAAPLTTSAIAGSRMRGKRTQGVLAVQEFLLGQALRTVGGLVGGDGAKVSAVGKHITSIEGVPSGVSSRATQLFLSKNSLRSLRGLDSFSNVARLSLSHNLLRRTADLRPLASLARLETLSLEGNPVCSAANYRAHVVSLASPCLRTLDRREVTPAEASDAAAIVAAEKSATGKTSRERCLCLLLDHMSGLLQCHAELREPLLHAAGGVGGGGGQRIPFRRLEWAGAWTGGQQGVWRQRSVASMPVQQMLTVLAVESWPAFDHSVVEELESRVLDEAAELFAEVLASRRAAGQRTHELTEGTTATLDSPGTRVWAQVLGEVQRRTEGHESSIVLRCEGIRRREAERFRRVSAQTNNFLHDLATSVGGSDNQWSVPLCAPAPPPPQTAAVRRPAGIGVGVGTSAHWRWKGQSSPEQHASPTLSLPPPPPPPPPSRPGPEDNRDAISTSGTHPADTTAVVAETEAVELGEGIPHKQQPQHRKQRRQQLHERKLQPDPVGAVDRIDLDNGHAAGETEERSAAEVATAGLPPVVRAGMGRGAEAPGEARPRECPPMQSSFGPASLASHSCFAPSAMPELGAVARGTAAAAAAAAAAATSNPVSTTMASAARFLLARGEGGHGRGGSSEAPSPHAAVQPPSACFREVAPEDVVPSNAGIVAQGDGTRSPLRGTDFGRSPTARREADIGRDVTDGISHVIGAAAYDNGSGSGTKVDGGGGGDSATVDGARSAAAAGDRLESGDGGGSGGSEATRRLLREALRVKRQLEGMDRADASASAIDNGLGDEDSGRFLAGLGLVELKPLSVRLAEALDRAPRALLGDSSMGVPEPRTTRGLRDQVAALGREVSQRVDACAEARKLHAALRKHVEAARRARARNLDTADVTCRRLIAKAGDEVQILQESRRVAQEAGRYHSTLAHLQEQIQATVSKTKKIITESETVARQLREEEEWAGELADRRRAAEEGLDKWERAAEADPGLCACRRAYDCEILVLRHRMGGNGGAILSAAFRRLRARTRLQRRARELCSRVAARRAALLARMAFDALARGSRASSAAAAAASFRCRTGLASWKRAASTARRARALRRRLELAAAARGLWRWRKLCAGGGAADGSRGGVGVEEEREELEWRLELFRERRAKGVVFRAWRGAAQTAAAAAMEAEARSGERWRAFRRYGRTGRCELAPCAEWGARLRTAEALARRRRFETQAGLAFRWWRRHRQSNALARTAGKRRALACWRRRASQARSAREATLEARGSYVVCLGRRVLVAWSKAAATRTRRRAGAAALASALAAVARRSGFQRWTSRAATATAEAAGTVVALEHSYDRCLRCHLRAWSAAARRARAWRRGADLLLRGRRFADKAAGLRLWRRQAARAREAALWGHRIKAWSAAIAKRHRLALLRRSFAAWADTRNRVAAIQRIARTAAARRRRLALAGGFRALCLVARRQAITGAAAGHDRPAGGNVLVAEAAVREALAEKATIEGKVGHLRARLAQEKARALERHSAAREVAEEVARSERERTRYAGALRRRVERRGEKPPTSPSKSSMLAEDGTSNIGNAGVGLQWNVGSVPSSPRVDGHSAGRLGEEEVEDRAGAAGMSAVEGELLNKVQAETRELRRRAAAAEQQEERLRNEAGRKSAAIAAVLKSTLAEGSRLKVEAEQRKSLIAELDAEARQAVAKAAVLSDRLAAAEQDLGFQAARNARRLREMDEGNVRLRAAAAQAGRRVAAAEDALRSKGQEIEELRARCARHGCPMPDGTAGRTSGAGKEGRGRGRGRGQGKNRGGGRRGGEASRSRASVPASAAARLEYRAFVAAADARSSAERCAAAAAERRVAAGSALADALREGESAAEIGNAEWACSTGNDGDDAGGNMAEAQRLAADCVADERRQVAGLELRGAEARLRRSAHLSVRASLGSRPLADPRSMLATKAGGSGSGSRRQDSEKGRVALPAETQGSGSDRRTGAPALLTGEKADRRGVNAVAGGSGAGSGTGPACRHGEGLDGTFKTTPLIESSSCLSSSPPSTRSSALDLTQSGQRDGGRSDSGRGHEGGEEPRGDRSSKKTSEGGGRGRTAAEDGLQDLKREIADLESKIMGRLGGGGDEAGRPTGGEISGGWAKKAAGWGLGMDEFAKKVPGGGGRGDGSRSRSIGAR